MNSIARRQPAVNAPRSPRPFDLIAALARLANAGYSRGLSAQLQIAAPPRAWLTVKEASEHSGLSVALLRRVIKSGKLPAVKDRSYKVRTFDLDNLDLTSGLSGSEKKPVAVMRKK